MPQLDPTSFPSQLFWLTVSFITLYLLMARFVLPRVQEVLETRQNRIIDDLDHSARYKSEAETVKESYEKALADARVRAQAQIAQMTKDAETEAARQQHSLDETLANKVAESEAGITRARKDAQSRLMPVAEELTAMVVEKLIHHRPAAQQVAATVNEIAKGKQL